MPMNAELRRRSTSWFGEVARAANDNTSTRPAPSRPRALIYRPAKSAMTSGRARTRRWVLEFEPQSAPFIEPLMGWTGSADPLRQVRLSFPSREAAVAFAERQGIAYEVQGVVAAPSPGAEMPAAAASAPARLPLELPRWKWDALLPADPAPGAGAVGSSPGMAA